MLPRDQRLTSTAKPLVIPHIVVFPADADMTTSQAVLDALQPGIFVVIADMSATQFCDSSAIRDLILAHNHATCTGAELRVVSPSSAVLQSLRAVGADQMLRLYPDMASALAGAPQTRELAKTARL